MQLTITELKLISKIANGDKNILSLASALKLSKSQTYRCIQNLKKKEILQDNYQPTKKTHINSLFQLLAKFQNVATPLSGTGIKIFSSILEPKKVKEIEKETNLHKTTILKKINQGRKMSLVIIKNNKYQLNINLWTDAKDFFSELKKYEELIDDRIPLTSKIYFKNESEILFSNKEEVDAKLTGFSAYSNCGIKIYLSTNYYFLPKKSLTKKEIFLHSLLITEKENNIQNLILITLFYLKYKKELKTIKHELIDNLKNVLKGENIKNYPSLQEIKDRAEMYDLEV